MPRNTTTGVFTRVSNSFSDPVTGTIIDPDDADLLFNDYDSGLLGYPQIMAGSVKNVNLNSANTDNAITITSPTTNYNIASLWVLNKGTTASLTTATAGLFTATGGGGLALAANQALSAITSNTVNTDTNGLLMTITVGNRTWINATTLQFRVGTAQGAAATADVYVFIRPFP